MSGRIVRRLRDGELPDRKTPLSRDSQDDAGLEVAAGSYVVKVTTPAGEASRRVALTW